MRTTLTLDPDVAALLKRAQARRRSEPLRKIVNDALREGLVRLSLSGRPGAPYRTPTVSLGRCLVGNLDDIAEALAVSEGETCR